MKRILIIRLSSLGDVILTTPVFQNIKESHPDWEVLFLTKESYLPIFENNPYVDRVIPFVSGKGIFHYIREVRRQKYDILLDLHNNLRSNLIRSLSGAKCRIKYKKGILKRRFLLWGIGKKKKSIPDVVDLYLAPLKKLGIEMRHKLPKLYISDEEKEWAKSIISPQKGKWVGVNPGAKWRTKEWLPESYTKLIEKLKKRNYNIILFGDRDDLSIAKKIRSGFLGKNKDTITVDMVGKTSLRQLFALISFCNVAVTTDSGPMHAACALGVPVVALFGPTVREFGFFPKHTKSIVLEADLPCRPCSLHGTNWCRRWNKECMERISVEEVEEAVERLLMNVPTIRSHIRSHSLNSILVIQTAFLGDMVLTLPMIQAIKKKAPHSFLALLAVPQNVGILQGNPAINEIITYDKKGREKGIISIYKLIKKIKQKNFQIAIIPHRSFTSSLIAWAAGIPRRIGFDESQGKIFLTDIIHYNMKKHFLERCLDLASFLGADISEKKAFIPMSKFDEEFIKYLFVRKKITEDDIVVGINPGSVWPTKRWTQEGYSQFSDMMIEKNGAKIVIFGGPSDILIAQEIERLMRNKPINLAGKTNLSQLAATIKRCKVFVTNDSGGMHIACALGVPVVALFGPTTLGIGFGPYGDESVVIQKELSCRPCGLHGSYKCRKGTFECMNLIHPEEVYNATRKKIYESRKTIGSLRD